jgi:hypothetical protein
VTTEEQSKPLHVQVAEALGYEVGYVGLEQRITKAVSPMEMVLGPVPRYDTDWAATGPLIEKYGISVRLSPFPTDAALPWVAWAGATDVTGRLRERGPTPLIAVCNLILLLKESGKL